MKRLIVIAVVLLAVCQAQAFEFITSSGGGLGKTVLLSNPSPTELLNVPVGASLTRSWRIETGLSREYDMKELDQVYASGSVRMKGITLAGGFSQFGKSELYSERTVKGSLAIQMQTLSLGINGSYLSASFGGGYSRRSTTGVGAAIAWRHKHLMVAISGDDLNSPVLNEGSPKREPIYSMHAEYFKAGAFSLMGRMTAQEKEPPQFALGQRVVMRKTGALLLGVSTGPLKIGGGVELGLSGARFAYTAQYHSVLGLTHNVSISYGSFVKRAEEDDGLR